MTMRHLLSHGSVLIIEIWVFDIDWNLSFVIWDLSGLIGKTFFFQVNP